MTHLLSIVLIALFVGGAVSCSDPKAAKAAKTARSETSRPTYSHRPVAKRDSAAYYIGRRDADELRSHAGSSDELSDALLEMQGRRYNIGQRAGAEAADAYVAGICQRLIELDDTLINIFE